MASKQNTSSGSNLLTQIFIALGTTIIIATLIGGFNFSFLEKPVTATLILKNVVSTTQSCVNTTDDRIDGASPNWITAGRIELIQKAYGSVAQRSDLSSAIDKYGSHYCIKKFLALAIFIEESNMGRGGGAALPDLSISNTECLKDLQDSNPCHGARFQPFSTWGQSARYLFKMLREFYVNGMKRLTYRDVFDKYAPYPENNPAYYACAAQTEQIAWNGLWDNGTWRSIESGKASITLLKTAANSKINKDCRQALTRPGWANPVRDG